MLQRLARLQARRLELMEQRQRDAEQRQRDEAAAAREAEARRLELMEQRQRDEAAAAERRFAALLERTAGSRHGSRASGTEQVFEEHEGALDGDAFLGDSRMYRKCLEILKRSLILWPNDTLQLPIYLASVDRVFEENHIPEELQVPLMKSLMNRDVCKLLLTFPPDAVSTWVKLKAALFDYYSLNSAKFRELFWSASKRSDESYSQFQLRISSYLTHYLESRNVDSFDDLRSLLIADKLRFTLSPEMLSEVGKRELSSFLSARELATFLDTACQLKLDCAHPLVGPPSGSSKGSSDKHGNSHGGARKKEVVCFSCGTVGHYSSSPSCPNYRAQTSTPAVVVSDNKPSANIDYRTRRLERFENNNNKQSGKQVTSVNGASGANRFTPKGLNGGKGFPPCIYCSRTNHASDRCFRKDNAINRVTIVPDLMQEECIEVPRYLADLAVSTLDNTCSCDFVRRGSGEVLHNQGCTLESVFLLSF